MLQEGRCVARGFGACSSFVVGAADLDFVDRLPAPGSEAFDRQRFDHMGVEETVEALECFARAQVYAEELDFCAGRVKIEHRVIVAMVECLRVTLIIGAVHIGLSTFRDCDFSPARLPY